MPEETLDDIIEERIIDELPPPPRGPPQPKAVASTTVPAIIYDCSVLRQQTASELLVQVCCRLDRSFPKAADVIKARNDKQRAHRMIEEWGANLRQAGFPEKARILLAVLDEGGDI